MILKPGIKTLGIKPELLIALFIADGIWKENGQELVITSLTDGKHKRVSRHYLGTAGDLRTYYFTASIKKKAARELRKALGKDYYVKLEKTHIHCSYKPQRP